MSNTRDEISVSNLPSTRPHPTYTTTRRSPVMSPVQYQYRAALVKVVDGDTVVVDLDLGEADFGFGVVVRGGLARQHLRLYGPDPNGMMGLNAPEKDTAEGVAARAYLAQLLGRFETLTVRTVKDHKEKYGRWLAVLYGGGPSGDPVDAVNVNQSLLDAGHAKLQKY